MKVRVDPERCQGHTLCAMIAPDLFTLDDVDGHSSAIDGEVPADLEAKAAEAIRSCPEQAIIHPLSGCRHAREHGTRHATTPSGRRTATTSTGTPPSTGSSSRRSPPRCWTSARSPGATPTAATGSRRAPRGVRARPLGRVPVQRPRPNGERRGYKGISIPSPERASVPRRLPGDGPARAAALPAAAQPVPVARRGRRWTPLVDELVRASLNEKIETGRIDFVDDLANIVPAVLTLAMLGMPLKNWDIYGEPVHASVYTPGDSPDIDRVVAMHRQMGQDLLDQLAEIRANPRPGLIHALAQARINGTAPDFELLGVISRCSSGAGSTPPPR